MNIQMNKDMFPDVTLLPNRFIDEHMIHADGEYVKIYLLLLRLLSSGHYEGPDQLADLLDLTQKDILRAFSYWEKQGLLSLQSRQVEEVRTEQTPVTIPAESRANATMDPSSVATARSPITVPDKQTMHPSAIQEKLETSNLQHSTFMAESYLGRPLTVTELNTFCYIDGSLDFSPDLLEYLIEYCVSKGKKNVRYIESVAINWYQQGIDTVEKAKNQSSTFQKETFSIMKAFGLGNRNPGAAEQDYIRSWQNMGFDLSIILEAISRTLIATHQSSFPYANRILESWKAQQVHKLEDIQQLDHKFHAETSRKQEGNPLPSSGKTAKQQNNSFHNFEQREYDYDDLEARLLHSGQ